MIGHKRTTPVCYLSGGMTGLPGNNHALFNRVARRYRALGYHVLNPAENLGGATDHPDGRAGFMRTDIASVLASDFLVLLPGWEKSEGAKLEVAIALELELEFYDADGRRLRPNVLVAVPEGLPA